MVNMGLSGGAIAGIVIGGLVLLAGLWDEVQEKKWAKDHRESAESQKAPKKGQDIHKQSRANLGFKDYISNSTTDGNRPPQRLRRIASNFLRNGRSVEDVACIMASIIVTHIEDDPFEDKFYHTPRYMDKIAQKWHKGDTVLFKVPQPEAADEFRKVQSVTFHSGKVSSTHVEETEGALPKLSGTEMSLYSATKNGSTYNMTLTTLSSEGKDFKLEVNDQKRIVRVQLSGGTHYDITDVDMINRTGGVITEVPSTYHTMYTIKEQVTQKLHQVPVTSIVKYMLPDLFLGPHEFYAAPLQEYVDFDAFKTHLLQNDVNPLASQLQQLKQDIVAAELRGGGRNLDARRAFNAQLRARRV